MKRVYGLPQLYEVVMVTPGLDPKSGMVATTDVLKWDRDKGESVPTNHPMPQDYMIRLREAGWTGWSEPVDDREDIYE